MSAQRLRVAASTWLALAGWACASVQTGTADTSGASGAQIIRGSDLSGTVLDGLRGRVAGMTVTTRPGECPLITLRGPRSSSARSNPSIYVDGTLMRDTCILAQIPSIDVDYVEVYAGGSSGRAGIGRNPYGLILVFRHRR